MLPLLKSAFSHLIGTLSRNGIRNLVSNAARLGGGFTCGPACSFFAGSVAGVVLDHLFAAADAEQQAASLEETMKKVLLDLEFQKGVRRLDELNSIRQTGSRAQISDARVLLTEARSFFLNASSTAGFPLLSARSDCYVGACNALLLLPDLQNYERAYATCVALETNYVYHPPGLQNARPDMNYAPLCALYSRRAVLWQMQNFIMGASDSYKKPMELYEQMGPIAGLLHSRGSRVPNLAQESAYTFDRYTNLWLDVKDKYCASR